MSEIQQVPSILTVIEDDPGEFIVRSSGDAGKRLAQGVLNALSEARRITVITDADVKVFKRDPNGAAKANHTPSAQPAEPPRKHIFQDAAAPPSPEAAEDEYDRVLRETEEAEAQARRDAAFNAQPAVAPAEEEPAPVKRSKTRQLDVTPNPCGRCGGSGQVTGDSGFAGVCPVCAGKGEIKAWGRGRRAGATR